MRARVCVCVGGGGGGGEGRLLSLSTIFSDITTFADVAGSGSGANYTH